MTDYTKNTNFGAKDALTSGDPNKRILGAAFDAEFDEIATAIASKEDKANKDQSNGYAGLDGTGALDPGVIPSSVAKLAATNNIFTGGAEFGRNGTLGYVTLSAGNATSPGYLSVFGPDNIRRGYFGFKDGSADNVVLTGDNGWGVYVGSNMTIAGAISVASGITGNLTGTASTATYATSAGTASSASTATSAGNADTVDGYHANEGAVASTVAARTSAGYLYSTYFNHGAAAENPTIAHVMVESGGDGFLRKISKANFFAQAPNIGSMPGVTIASDPGTTPSGSAGQMFLYY